MTTVTHEEAAARIERYLERNAILRGKWFGGGRGDDGYERACLLVAAVPEVGRGDYSACPASLLPEWMARLTPWLDDNGSDDRHTEIVRRYAGLLRRSNVLTPPAWERLDYRVRRVALAEARKHAEGPSVLDVVDRVLGLLDRAIAGGAPSKEEWANAREAAAAAKRAATARAAAALAASATRAAAALAALAAEASASASAAAAACDRMIADMLDAWEDEIEKAEPR